MTLPRSEDVQDRARQGDEVLTLIRPEEGVCAPTYELYGLRIRSEVPLGAPLHPSASPDLDVRWGEGFALPDEPSEGIVLAALLWDDGRGYTHTETATGYRLRFHATCEFRIDRQCRSIRVHLAPGVNPGIVPLLLAGNVVACVLTLAGEGVLHASAVEVEGAALAFVGHSGMGKSTLAALFCARGARPITDDLLRLELNGTGIRCFPGTPEIRLRSGAAALAEQFPASVSEPTADGRLALRLDTTLGSRPPLRAIVIPRPSRTCHTIRCERLTPLQAFLSLTRYPRVLGWRTTEPIRGQFHWVGHVARSVPVFEVEIPWGPPFAPDLTATLLRDIGFDHTLTETPA